MSLMLISCKLNDNRSSTFFTTFKRLLSAAARRVATLPRSGHSANTQNYSATRALSLAQLAGWRRSSQIDPDCEFKTQCSLQYPPQLFFSPLFLTLNTGRANSPSVEQVSWMQIRDAENFSCVLFSVLTFTATSFLLAAGGGTV